MAEMFGAPIGISRAEADLREQRLADLALDKGAVDLEVAKTKLEQNKRMLSLMTQSQGTPSSGQYDLADNMNALAEMALKSGLPEEARQYAETGANLRRTTSQIDNALFTQKMKHLTLLSNLMGGVTDERSWNRANALFKMETGKDTPFAGQPYSPELVASLQRSFMTAKDQATAEAAKARQRASEASVREHEARLPLIRAQTEEVRARTAKLKKAGASQIVPKAGDVKIIKDLIINEYGAGVMPEEASTLAQPVAERMLEILKDSSITKSQAAYRAFQEAKSGGHFGGLRPRMRMKGTKENPLDIPATDGKADASKLRPNMYYKGVGKYAGKMLLWNGRTFQEVEEVSQDVDEVVEEEEEVPEEAEDAYLNPDNYNPDDFVGAE